MSPASVRWSERAPAAWDALLAADPGATPAHRPGVWRAFAAVMPDLELRVATVESGGGTIGGAPVLVQRRGPFRWLHALPLRLPGTPLALPGRHAEVDAALARALDALARETGAVGGEWACYRPGGPAVADAALALAPGETLSVETAVIALGAGGLEAAAARRSRKERQALQHPRLARYAFREDAGALQAAYALHVAQSRAWAGHRALPLALAERLLRERGDAPLARLFTLSDTQGVASAALALDGPRETFVWWSGTHPDARRAGAAPLLLWRIAEWADAHGRDRINLGASTGLDGVAALKRALGAETVVYPVRCFGSGRAGALGRAVARLQSRLRRARRTEGAA